MSKYKYKIPAVNGKPLIEIPQELKQKIDKWISTPSEIIIEASDLIDELLRYPSVEVINLETGKVIPHVSLEEYTPYPYSAIVCKDEDYVYAFKQANNWKGVVLIDKGEAGVDDAKVIQSAINSLTPERTWKEMIVLKGNFYLEDELKVYSYTILDLKNAKITMKDGINKPIIETLIGETDIEIIGGIFDHNGSKQSGGQAVVWLRDVTRSIIKDIHIVNGYYRGLEIDGGYGNIVDNVWIENCNQHGLMVWSQDSTRKLNHVIKSIITKNNGGNGVDLGTVNKVSIDYIYSYGDKVSLNIAGCNNIQVSSVFSENTTIKGIGLDIDYTNCENIQLQKLIILNSGGRGIQVITFNGYNLKNIILDTVIVDNPTLEGLFIGANSGNISNVEISKIIVMNAGNSTASKDAVVLQALTGYTLEELTIHSIDCYDEEGYQNYGLYIAAGGIVRKVRILGGRLHGSLGTLHTYGSPEFHIENVEGYITENSGIATITGDGTSTSFTVDITHGLVTDDPSKVVVNATAEQPAQIGYSFVDTDDDGFAETIRLTVNFALAPASGQVVRISWRSEVV